MHEYGRTQCWRVLFEEISNVIVDEAPEENEIEDKSIAENKLRASCQSPSISEVKEPIRKLKNKKVMLNMEYLQKFYGPYITSVWKEGRHILVRLTGNVRYSKKMQK